MKKTTLTEEEIIKLLNDVLPDAIKDPKISSKIMNAVRKELKYKSQATAFNEYCRICPLPDLTEETVQVVASRFEEAFGKENLEIAIDAEGEKLVVELTLGNSSMNSEITVNERPLDETDEPEIKLKHVPFPVALPGDKELVWLMAKKENLSPEEAGIALASVQVEFWESKSGQNQIRKGAERSFPEFVTRVPARMLSEVGLKRHYKEPEAIKILQQLKS